MDQMNSRELGEILGAVPLPLVVIDPDGRIAAANAPGADLLGAEQIGRDHAIGLRQPALLAAIQKALQGSGPEQVREQIRYEVLKAPHATSYLVTVTPVRVASETMVICAFEDITEREFVTQFRRDFIANISHELRSPLTALMGIIETLEGPARDDPAARTRFLKTMKAEAARMSRLVRDLLSLSQAEARERERPEVPVDIPRLVAGVVDALRPVAKTAGVTLEIAGTAPVAPVPADADQITQVVQNLVENAIKYDRRGKRVTIAVLPDEAGDMLRIDIVDQGQGIEPQHLPRLTERFYRVDPSRSRGQGGTGLGLAIVKHIIHRHRGRLGIASTLGEGTRVSVFLPRG